MSRTSLTSALMLASAMLVAAGPGCSASQETVALEDAALDPGEQQALIEELASAPAFRSYVKTAIALQTRSAWALAAMTPADLAAVEADAAALLADARAGHATFGELARRMTELTGTTVAELQAVGNGAANLTQQYPQLHSTGPALFGQVIQYDPELHALFLASASGEDDPPTDELAACYRDCQEEYTWDHARATTTFWQQTAGCTQSGPVGALCSLVAWIEYELAQAQAQAELDDCLEICRGDDPDGECDDDDDCEPDQWCDHGTLGFGDNQCEPDKATGEVCSRHAKCLSGCCAYDFWQHPVSMTCNPARDC